MVAATRQEDETQPPSHFPPPSSHPCLPRLDMTIIVYISNAHGPGPPKSKHLVLILLSFFFFPRGPRSRGETEGGREKGFMPSRANDWHELAGH